MLLLLRVLHEATVQQMADTVLSSLFERLAVGLLAAWRRDAFATPFIVLFCHVAPNSHLPILA
jgi:hypothetical protein